MTKNTSGLTVGRLFLDNLVKTLSELGHELNVKVPSDDYIPADVLVSAWGKAVDITQNPAIGLLVGEHSRQGRWGIVEHLVINSQNLQQALDHSIRYWGLLGFSDLQMSLTVESGTACLSVHSRINCRQINDSDMIYTLRLIQSWVSEAFKCTHLTLAHSRPDCVAAYQKILGFEPSFGGGKNLFYFESHWLGGDSMQFNPVLAELLHSQAEVMQQKLLNTSSMAAKILELLSTRPACNIAEAAEILNLSARSLRRKLGREKTSFSALAEQNRQRLCQRYMSDQDNCFAEVAFMLGYSDISSFNHAFQRWFACTPTEYRQRSSR